MKKQIELILTAFGFFTRIPIPKHIAFSQENLNKCNRYFPIIGYVVGGITALSYLVFSFILPDTITILLSMVTSILLTGAFHEDGFADVCDAFGGGWTKEKILIIMKDSRVGAYGVVGIILLLMIKYTAIASVNSNFIAQSILIAHVLSRFMAVWTMHSLIYVREDESSKSKPITKSMEMQDLIIAGLLTLPVLFIDFSWLNLAMPIPLIITKILFERYFKKWIGGYTGDCLGAIQQSTEVVVYIYIVAINSNSSFFAELNLIQ